MDINLTCDSEVEHGAVPLAWLDKVRKALLAASTLPGAGENLALLAAEVRFLSENSDTEVVPCPFDGDVEVLPTQHRDIGVAECPLCGTEHDVDKADLDPRD